MYSKERISLPAPTPPCHGRNVSGDAIRDSLVDPNASEVSDGVPDGCKGQIRDGLDSLLEALTHQVSITIIKASSATATRLSPPTETVRFILWVSVWAMS